MEWPFMFLTFLMSQQISFNYLNFMICATFYVTVQVIYYCKCTSYMRGFYGLHLYPSIF
jgi:hypothetical protein